MKKAFVILALSATALVSTQAIAQAKGGVKVGQTRVAELAKAEKMFQRLDADKDGTLTAAEVTTVMQARATKSGKAFKPKSVNRLISHNDGNADGKVTLDEFKAAAGTHFDAADTNKNGTIDADEGASKGAAPAAASGDE